MRAFLLLFLALIARSVRADRCDCCKIAEGRCGGVQLPKSVAKLAVRFAGLKMGTCPENGYCLATKEVQQINTPVGMISSPIWLKEDIRSPSTTDNIVQMCQTVVYASRRGLDQVGNKIVRVVSSNTNKGDSASSGSSSSSRGIINLNTYGRRKSYSSSSDLSNLSRRSKKIGRRKRSLAQKLKRVGGIESTSTHTSWLSPSALDMDFKGTSALQNADTRERESMSISERGGLRGLKALSRSRSSTSSRGMKKRRGDSGGVQVRFRRVLYKVS